MPDDSFSSPKVQPLLGERFSALALIERERRVLKEIAAGVPIKQVLEGLLLAVEEHSSQRLKASVLFISDDGRYMLHGAAPSLPKAYNDAIHGIAIGEGIGSCGTAAARGTPVYARDIATDPLWQGYAELATGHGLRACWSMPIRAAQDRVLGTFAVYYDEPRDPTEADIEAIALITQTAALAIERHQSDRELHRSRNELRALNNALERQVQDRAAKLDARTQERDRAWGLSQELLVINLPDGTFEAVNARWEEQLGWTEADLLGTKFADYTHPDDLEATVAAFNGLLKAPLTEPHEYRLRHKDGSYRWFSWTGSCEDGKVYAAGRHVTAEKAQAEALRQAQKMEAVGQLTGGVAHDFNNLLTVIRSSTDLLKRSDLSEERRMRYVNAISQTIDRAAKLTGQLLAFARRQTLQPVVFAVCDSVRGIDEMMGTLTGSRIEIITNLPTQRCFVNADPSQFDTALVNMALNARDAMSGEGQMIIAVKSVDAVPAIRSHPPVAGRYVAISVTDTGVGIARSSLEQVFEPFYTTKDIGHGTGLGLSQVFGFAKQSGGEIDVVSQVGQGTTFTLYLPRVDEPVDYTTSVPAADKT